MFMSIPKFSPARVQGVPQREGERRFQRKTGKEGG